MHRFHFKPDDLFINRLKTYPEYNVFIYQGQMHVNRDTRLSGSGGLVVYDVNRNLTGSGLNRVVPFVVSSSAKPALKSHKFQPLVSFHSGDFQWATSYVNGVGQQFLTSSTTSYSSLKKETINNTENAITGTYGFESPITRKLTTKTAAFVGEYWDMSNGQPSTPSAGSIVLDINTTSSALQNVARKYTTLSDHFIFTSSSIRSRDLVSGAEADNINFISIPSMYYGSSIKKGSVELNYYITGSKIASCADINENGTLIGTTGSTSGSVVGVVMYDEGIIMLTSSVNLETGPSLGIRYGGGLTPVLSSWIYYGTGLNDQINTTLIPTRIASASYDLNFKGTSYVNTMTMFAHAEKGHLNHSNNPTYKSYAEGIQATTGSGPIYYDGEYDINNVVSASYASASFEKTTYISKVHIYDEDGNLIAITSMARPVKKTLNDEFTFKMKLDL